MGVHQAHDAAKTVAQGVEVLGDGGIGNVGESQRLTCSE